MKFTIYGKNMHVSDGLKETLKKKFEKFDRYFDKETEVYATFSKEKNAQMLEVTIPMGKTILRAEERSEVRERGQQQAEPREAGCRRDCH